MTTNLAERVTVGMCMANPEDLGKVLALGVSPASFHDLTCQEVFAAMVEAERSSRPFDLCALSIALPERTRELVDMAESVPPSQQVTYYAQEVLKSYWLRQAIWGANDLVRLAASLKPFDDVDSFRAMAQQVTELIAAGPASKQHEVWDAASLVAEWERTQEEKVEAYRAGKMLGIPTGIKLLDKGLAGGWSPGGMYTIAARTGRGKTSLGVHTSLAAARAGFHVCYFTVEMPARDIMTKFVSNASGVVGSKLQVGSEDDREIERHAEARRQLERLPFYVNDSWRGSLDAFKRICRRLSRQGKLHMAVLDYMGLVTIDGKSFGSRTNLVAEVTGQVKSLAMELGIAILALSQLNREAEKEDSSPSTHHISDSDKVGHDSDAVILIYRDQAEQTFIKLSKNRWGREGRFPVNADLGRNRFLDLNLNESAVFGD